MKHIHKLYQTKLGKETRIYKCFHCPSYYLYELAFGQKTICWKCGDDFLLLKRKNNQVKPKCIDCSGIKKDISLDQVMKNLGLE